MTWTAFTTALSDLNDKFQHGKEMTGGELRDLTAYQRLRRETLTEWERRKNRCLKNCQPAFDQQSWGIIYKVIFTVRFIYHSVMAFIFEYIVPVLRAGNFMYPRTYIELRDANVGDRMAILLLEWNGIGYNLQKPTEQYPFAKPLNTVEYRLWNHLNGN